MRVHSLVNQKGGCGKTTAAINLAAALAARGRRVLMVDLDPQAHGTLGLGVDPGQGLSLYDVLAEGVSSRSAVLRAPGGFDLIPSSPRLLEFEEVSARMLRPEGVLRGALLELAGAYDDALLDCPARADGVLTANALQASSVALLVVETGAFALQGALRAIELFAEIGARQGSSFDLRVLGTLFDRRTRFARDLLVAMQARFGAAMFDTVVRTSVRLREAAAHGVPVRVLDPRSRAAGDFDALAEELLAVALERGAPLRPAPGSAVAPSSAGAAGTLVPVARVPAGRPAPEAPRATSDPRHHSRG